MMLQGHFISSLLSNEYKNESNTTYQIWEYFRGITAPVFFTVTGFIFLFLVLKNKKKGWNNPRIKSGIIRGLKLIGWGYLLRLGIAGILVGQIHAAYFYTDVLHIIGVSIILLSILYIALQQYKILGEALLLITLLSFLFERSYNGIFIPYLPQIITHYLTNANGAIFTIFPWFGYVTIGGFLAVQYIKHKNYKNFYTVMPMCLGTSGLFLMYLSSPVLFYLNEITQQSIFIISGEYNYLFARLGDVLLLFTIVVYARNLIQHPIFIKIGEVTLSVYIVHHIILYGSWFNTGLVRWLHNTLTLTEALLGALIFMIITTSLVLKYKDIANQFITNFLHQIHNFIKTQTRSFKDA